MRMQTFGTGVIVCGAARFSYLGNGLVRIEHSPDGSFCDRPTLRAFAPLSPRPFSSVEFSETGVRLETPEMTIDYTDAPELTKENLSIEWRAGGMEGTYRFGDLEHENLGSPYTLDHFYDAQIPDQGVHPGGSQTSSRYGEMNLFNTNWNIAEYAKAHPEEVRLMKPILWTTFKRYEKMPEGIKKELDIWKKFPSGPVSKAGYWTMDESGMYCLDEEGWPIEDPRTGCVNFFFGCYGRDFKRAMNQFAALLGKTPIPPRWAFGNWYSRFYPYTEKEVKEVVRQFEKHDVPLDVLIVDMDWHKNGWAGWDIAEEKFPDFREFCEWKDKAGLKIGLNLHDEDICREDSHFKKFCEMLGLPEDCAPEKEDREDFQKLNDQLGLKIRRPGHSKDLYHVDYLDKKNWEAFQKVCYDPMEEAGVDFWWEDIWQGLYPHINMNLWKMELLRRRQEKRGKRPMFLNRYAGWGSHRYPAFFSGDTGSHWPVLKMEAKINQLAAHVDMSYFSHDLGGFVGEVIGELQGHVSPELYVRWMQLGAMCPIMRVHSDHGIREPWNYAPEVEKLASEAYRLHHSLVPYFYHYARENYDTGCPIIRPVYFEQPDDPEAFAHEGEYFVGEKLFFSPIVEQGGFHTVKFPKGEYVHFTTGEKYKGGDVLEDRFRADYMPLFAKAGAIIPRQALSKRLGSKAPDPLIFSIFPGGNDQFAYYEDDGTSPDYAENFLRLPLTHEETREKTVITAEAIVGFYPKAKTTRDLRFDFLFAEKPSKVTLTDQKNDGAEKEFSYDEETKTLTVELKAQNLKFPFALTVIK